MAGRKATPDIVKEAKGTNQKCRERKVSLKQAPGGIRAPEWLRKDAMKYFEAIRNELDLIGLNSRTYSLIAAMAASRQIEIENCNLDIETNGTKIENGTLIRINPSVTQLNEAMRHLQSLSTELGLTATAVGRVGKIKEEKDPTGFGGL